MALLQVLPFTYGFYAVVGAIAYSIFPQVYQNLLSSLGVKIFTMGGSGIILVGGYVLFSLPYHIFQFFPGMDKYKVQQQRRWTLTEQWECIKYVTFSHGFIYLPAAILGYNFIILNNLVALSYDTIPSWYSILARCIFAMLFEDTWHYWNHRLLHHKKLYPYIHKKHHTYQSPFPLAAEYAHPLETIWLGMGFFLPCLLIVSHIAMFWAWLIVRLLQTTEVHSGYYLPWINPLYLIPFYGGVRFHDFHHQNFLGNYASSFIYWDRWLGTDKQFKKFTKNKLKLQIKP